MTEVNGTLKKIYGVVVPEEHATIELPPVKLEDIKVGSEIWVKMEVRETTIPLMKDGGYFLPNDIIHHIPAEKEKPEGIEPLEGESAHDALGRISNSEANKGSHPGAYGFIAGSIDRSNEKINKILTKLKEKGILL